MIAAILNNFSAVESSLETMKDSAGSADREMGIIEQSLEYKINRLKETGVGVFQNLFQREDMGIVIDTLTGILNVIGGITEKLGTIPTLALAITTVSSIKNFGRNKMSFLFVNMPKVIIVLYRYTQFRYYGYCNTIV